MPKKANKKAASTKKSATNTQSKAKPAKSAAKAPAKKKVVKPKGTGRRYTPAEKATVLKFVEGVNAKSGRGGAAAAARKFGISQITVGQWVKKSGSKAAPKKATAGKKPGRKPGRKPAAAKASGFSAKLRRLADVHEAIGKMKSELASLEAEYAKLKKSL